MGGQPGPRPDSWDDPYWTYISNFGAYEPLPAPGLDFIVGYSGAELNFFPQPGWEWVRFDNLSTGSLLIDAISINTSCTTVPLPGAVWLLGSGLLGLAGWRRVRKS